MALSVRRALRVKNHSVRYFERIVVSGLASTGLWVLLSGCVRLAHISSRHTIAGRWLSPAPRNWVQSTHVGVTRVIAGSVDREQIHHEDQVAERLATFVVALTCSVRLLSRDDQHDLGAEFLSCKSLCPTLDDPL